jgi:hypothetical protein
MTKSLKRLGTAAALAAGLSMAVEPAPARADDAGIARTASDGEGDSAGEGTQRRHQRTPAGEAKDRARKTKDSSRVDLHPRRDAGEPDVTATDEESFGSASALQDELKRLFEEEARRAEEAQAVVQREQQRQAQIRDYTNQIHDLDLQIADAYQRGDTSLAAQLMTQKVELENARAQLAG